MTHVSPEILSLVNQLHLPDHELAEKFQLTSNGEKLTFEESITFIQFLKQELSCTIN
jgi:hypothetical protein